MKTKKGWVFLLNGKQGQNNAVHNMKIKKNTVDLHKWGEWGFALRWKHLCHTAINMGVTSRWCHWQFPVQREPVCVVCAWNPAQ